VKISSRCRRWALVATVVTQAMVPLANPSAAYGAHSSSHNPTVSTQHPREEEPTDRTGSRMRLRISQSLRRHSLGRQKKNEMQTFVTWHRTLAERMHPGQFGLWVAGQNAWFLTKGIMHEYSLVPVDADPEEDLLDTDAPETALFTRNKPLIRKYLLDHYGLKLGRFESVRPVDIHQIAKRGFVTVSARSPREIVKALLPEPQGGFRINRNAEAAAGSDDVVLVSADSGQDADSTPHTPPPYVVLRSHPVEKNAHGDIRLDPRVSVISAAGGEIRIDPASTTEWKSAATQFPAMARNQFRATTNKREIQRFLAPRTGRKVEIPFMVGIARKFSSSGSMRLVFRSPRGQDWTFRIQRPNRKGNVTVIVERGSRRLPRFLDIHRKDRDVIVIKDAADNASWEKVKSWMIQHG
jgi:hypothetical protein